jgi:hypothetical protein
LGVIAKWIRKEEDDDDEDEEEGRKEAKWKKTGVCHSSSFPPLHPCHRSEPILRLILKPRNLVMLTHYDR